MYVCMYFLFFYGDSCPSILLDVLTSAEAVKCWLQLVGSDCPQMKFVWNYLDFLPWLSFLYVCA